MTDSEKPTEPITNRVLDRHPDHLVKPGTPPLTPEDVEGDLAPEDLDGEIGAEGGSQSGSHKAAMPWVPAKDDDSPLGSTDQHSNA